MWKVSTVYVALASTVLAQQHTFGDVGHQRIGPIALPETPYEPAINTGIRTLIQKLVRSARIPGLSLGVVRADGLVEMANWGVRNEGGDRMTSDVSFFPQTKRFHV